LLDATLSHIRPGDCLVVWKLDRLGQTVKQLVEFVADLQARGIEFRSLTEGIDTSTPAGRYFFHMMVALAEMGRNLIRERTRAGLDAARAQGLVGGRKRAIDDKKLIKARLLLEGGTPPKEVAETLQVSVPRSTATSLTPHPFASPDPLPACSLGYPHASFARVAAHSSPIL
jgi:DNA invertase Pin-like site-specific DNA recombinase